jgi:hypothetical protein
VIEQAWQGLITAAGDRLQIIWQSAITVSGGILTVGSVVSYLIFIGSKMKKFQQWAIIFFLIYLFIEIIDVVV